VVVIQPTHQGLDVFVWHHVPSSMHYKQAFDLGFVNLAFIFTVHSLKQFSNLQVTFTLYCHNPSMKLLDLPLNLLLNLDLALKQLCERAENVVALLLDVTLVLSFNSIQESVGDFLV